MPGNLRLSSTTARAVFGSMSRATGTGWYGEPFQQTGGGLAPSVPQFLSLSRSSDSGMLRAFDRRAMTAAPSSSSRPRAARSTVTTIEVRLATSGRPAWSRMSPRGAALTISRTVFCTAAARYSGPVTTCR